MVVNNHSYSGAGTVRNNRVLLAGRRHNSDMSRVPFKDSHGATIKECRRKILDRRINYIKAEWIKEIVIG
jgi:hypothetical protein